MAWEENSCICLHMQLITILSRIGVKCDISKKTVKTVRLSGFRRNALTYRLFATRWLFWIVWMVCWWEEMKFWGICLTSILPNWGTLLAQLGLGACPSWARCLPNRGTVLSQHGHGAFPWWAEKMSDSCPKSSWCNIHIPPIWIPVIRQFVTG